MKYTLDFQKLFIASALIVSTAGLPMAQDKNKSVINQSSSNNRIYSQQQFTGTTQQYNYSGINQSGSNGSIFIQQIGTANTANQTQTEKTIILVIMQGWVH